MRARLQAFIHALRQRGIDVSVAEGLDAVRAVAVAGVERVALREALAATLVKDEADRGTFDRLFDEMFPAIGAGGEAGARRRRRRGGGGGEAASGHGARGDGAGGRAATAVDGHAPAPEPGARRADSRRDGAGEPQDASPRAGRTARRRELLTRPFRELTARDVAEARDLVRELGRRLEGRLARRLRAAKRGRLDFRRTIRGALSTGGTPVRPAWRTRRPGRPDLVALCDLSGSVAAASELLLGLVAPASAYFRRVHLYAYVDRLCPVSIEGGHVAPGGTLDLHARSDFGRVLEELWTRERGVLTRSAIVLVLGDARNNRRPPRADLLRAVRDRVQTVLWLVPEPRARWNTGDSVLDRYAPACDAVIEALDLATLVAAVRRAL